MGFVALITAGVITLSARYFNRQSAVPGAVGLVGWLLYVGLLGYFGVARNTTMRPPGIAFILIPVVIFLGVFIFRMTSAAGLGVVLAIPLWIILGAQSFRMVVELFLHQLWLNGLIPKMLTFEGANVDIFIGLSAPLIAWLSTRGSSGRKLVFIWNVLGLLALANVVIRALLTAPGPFHFIHAEVPNLMFGTFPFMFIPAFFVPLAVVLHVVALRASCLHMLNQRGSISTNLINL